MSRRRLPLMGAIASSRPWTPLTQWGSNLWFWGRVGLGGSTLQTVGDWRDPITPRSYLEATNTLRPTYSGGGADFNGTTSRLSAGTPVVTSGAFTEVIDFKLDALPALANYSTLGVFRQAATPTAAYMLCANIVGYQPYHFGAVIPTAGSPLRVGIADALTTNRTILAWTWNGGTATTAANYSARLGNVARTVVASGASGITATEETTIGCRVGTATNTMNGVVYERVRYSRVLTSDELDDLYEWFTNHTPGFEPTTISGLLEWIQPELDYQAGDLNQYVGLDQAGRTFTQATLANMVYKAGSWSYADGQPAFSAPSNARFMTTPDPTAFAGATLLTVSYWMKQPIAAIAETIGQLASAANDNAWWNYFHTTGGLHGRMAVSTSATDTATYGAMPGGSLTANTWTRVTWRYRGGGVGNAGRLQGFLGSTAQVLSFSGTIPASIRDSAALARIFSLTGAGLIGSLDDIVVVTGVDVTDGQVGRLATYYTRTG